MAYTILNRNLCLFSKYLPSAQKRVVPFSLYVFYFSTSSTERKSVNNSAYYKLLFRKHSLSPTVASNVASVLCQSKIHKDCDSTLSYMTEIGFTKLQLEKTLKFFPKLLLTSLEKTIKPKIKIFQDMGFSREVIADIISGEPKILHRSGSQKLIPQLGLLRGLLGSNKRVATVLKKVHWVLGTDLEKNMLPNVELLRSCSVSMEQIITICNYASMFLMNRPEVVRKYIDKVDEMGVNRNSKVFVYAVAVIGSMPNGKWEQKVQAFRDILQCSEDDILRYMRHDHPVIFTVSEDKMSKVKEVILGTGKYNVSCITNWPRSLMFGIEQRLKPHCEILVILESRHLIETWPSLQVLCRMKDDRFYKKFVSPHLDVLGEAYLVRRMRDEKKI